MVAIVAPKNIKMWHGLTVTQQTPEVEMAEQMWDLFSQDELDLDFGILTEMLCSPGTSYEEAKSIALRDLKEFRKEKNHERQIQF